MTVAPLPDPQNSPNPAIRLAYEQGRAGALLEMGGEPPVGDENVITLTWNGSAYKSDTPMLGTNKVVLASDYARLRDNLSRTVRTLSAEVSRLTDMLQVTLSLHDDLQKAPEYSQELDHAVEKFRTQIEKVRLHLRKI